MTDEFYMNIALELAKKGCGLVSPNPMVGAVIVKDGNIIGKGWHEQYGGLHAERNALARCSESPQGATMYVNLEPCCHYGKTPPCTEAILEHGIKKVVIGSIDPNHIVAGKGIAVLKAHSVEVVTGVLEDKCKELNQVFFHYIQTKRPFVVMKYAMTMDGKIATVSGKSKWITGEVARNQVHQERHRYSSIMVGVGTVIEDNPMLNCRIDQGRNPIRILCDTNLRTPLDSNIVMTAKNIRTIVATSCEDLEKQRPYLKASCELIVVKKKGEHLDLVELMDELGKRKIDSILLEGGASLNASALEGQIVQRVQTYISPKLFGGKSAKTPIGGRGVQEVKDCYELIHPKIHWFEEDLCIESEVKYPCLQESLKKLEP